MSIVQASQFVGKYALTKAFNDGQLKIVQIIDDVELKYLNELFGVELCENFLAEYVDEQKYIKLLSPFVFQDGCEVRTTRGITEMLLALTYCHYLNEMQGTATSVGKTIPNPEAGKLANDLNVISFYNNAIKDFKVIQRYLDLNKDVYPEFKGVHKTYNYSF